VSAARCIGVVLELLDVARPLTGPAPAAMQAECPGGEIVELHGLDSPGFAWAVREGADGRWAFSGTVGDLATVIAATPPASRVALFSCTDAGWRAACLATR
jgi:hypothetical protein